jgi:hypothetical protein
MILITKKIAWMLILIINQIIIIILDVYKDMLITIKHHFICD